jgi:transcriptional regulator with GAF, ATPase, and Fis domain
MALVRKVAVSPSAVLLRGESGTGKELLARAVHDNSPRAGKAFVKVHCAALSPTLLESELFGHVKGAFTNAIRDKPGRFEAAHGGTLFLDEIGDISLDVQTKLLRVLQEMRFERVGSNEAVQVDVRIIAATHQDLEALIRQGRFREDLFYRLNVFPIAVPPLRWRVEDVPELALHFLRLYAERSGKEMSGIDDDAMVRLKEYTWPGNIRQLENVIERAVVIAEGRIVTADDLPDELWHESTGANAAETNSVWPPDKGGPPSMVQSARAERERREREQLVRALAAAGGNKAVAARALGMARSTLVSRLKRLGLS